jgi:hypothetical protein
VRTFLHHAEDQGEGSCRLNYLVFPSRRRTLNHPRGRRLNNRSHHDSAITTAGSPSATAGDRGTAAYFLPINIEAKPTNALEYPRLARAQDDPCPHKEAEVMLRCTKFVHRTNIC